MGIFVFWTERDWSRSCLVSRTLLQYFQRYCLFSILPFLVANNRRHHWSNLHNRKTSISLKRRKIFQKEKCHSSIFWKAFQISRKYFSCHRHFKKLTKFVWRSSTKQNTTIIGSFRWASFWYLPITRPKALGMPPKRTIKYLPHLNSLQGPISWKPRKLFGPAKPFSVNRLRQRWIHLKLLVWREPL